jgi:transcription antitermination factor NusG
MNKDLIPNGKKKLPTPVNGNAWQTEQDSEFESLEDLLNIVEENINKGANIAQVLRRKYLPESKNEGTNHFNNNSSQVILEYIREKTAKPYVGIRHLCTVIYDSIYFITRDRGAYPGKAVRMVSVVTTTMIHYGLSGLDTLLSGRLKVVEERLESIRLGSKEKRRKGQLPQYVFVNFVETMDKQQNIACLCQQDYARATTIAVDYGWTLGFVIQIAMAIAVASSERLPVNMVKDAKEEVRYFQEYLNKNY